MIRCVGRHRFVWSFGFALLLCVACGSHSPTGPTPTPGSTSATVAAYLSELVGVMQTHSVNRGLINWADFQAQVIHQAEAVGAQSVSDAKPAIALALGLLGDGHSFYQSST